MSDVTPEGGTPEWATSVNAFAAASRKSVTTTTATQLQFPDTSQLHGVCGNAFSGSAFTNGLLNYGDPNTQGVAGAMIWGTQSTADTLCGMMGGAGTDTTPQAVVSGASDVQTTVDNSPMASGTIELGQNGEPSGNVALDAINGVQNLANTLYGILNACGCGSANDPANVSPQQVIDTTQETADGITGSPFASGIIAMGQDPTGSGNVALDAINGTQYFAGSLFNTLLACANCGGGMFGAVDGQLRGEPVAADIPLDGQLLAGELPDSDEPISDRLFGEPDPNPYAPENVSAQTILDVAEATATVWAENPFAQDIVGAGSGNIAIDGLYYGQSLVDSTHAAISYTLAEGATANDLVDAAGQAINQNTANLQGGISLTTAQSVNLLNQNLLVSEDFSTQATVATDPDGNWVWDGTDNAPSTDVLGCLKLTASGNLHEYLSSEIPVVAGENIEIACQVKTVGLSYTGTDPVVLGVQRYRRMRYTDGTVMYVDVGGVDLDTLASPSATQDWTGLAAIYTAEPKVDQIRLRFKVPATATAGVVKFDAAALLKTDPIADECVPGVGTTVDNIVTELYGEAGEGFSHNAAATALGKTANALTSVNARLAALEAQGYTGALAGEDFSFIGEIEDDPNWGGGYSQGSDYGYYSADGTNAVWQPWGWVWTPADQQWAYFDYVGTDAASDTDYQLIQLLLASPPQSVIGAWPFYPEYVAYIYLIGRLNSDWTSYVYATFGSDGYYAVGYAAGGSRYPLSDGYTAVPGSGSMLSFYIGDYGNTSPRKFKLMVNSDVIVEHTEVGTASPLGASNRKWGWAAYASAGSGDWGLSNVQSIPPNVNQFLAYDVGA